MGADGGCGSGKFGGAGSGAGGDGSKSGVSGKFGVGSSS